MFDKSMDLLSARKDEVAFVVVFVAVEPSGEKVTCICLLKDPAI